MRRGLFLFTNDLRLHDQPALSQLAAQVDELLLVFCLDPSQRQPGRYQQAALGEHRLRFLRESLRDLQHRLAPLGQRLTTLEGSPLSVLPKLIADYDIALVASSLHNGIDEQRQWQRLQQRSPGCRFLQANSHSLFDAEQLPFPPQGLPDSFSKFRRRVEALSVPVPQTEITALPPPPAGWRTESRAGHSAAIAQRFIGGKQRHWRSSKTISAATNRITTRPPAMPCGAGTTPPSFRPGWPMAVCRRASCGRG